jgi:NCAIR mutase (PurE)-related protein
LEKVQKGTLTAAQAYKKLEHLPYENLRIARLDHHRSMRTNMPEVVFAQGKSLTQLRAIVPRLKCAGHSILITRLEKPVYTQLKKNFPFLSYSQEGKIAYWKPKQSKKKKGGCSHVRSQNPIAVITAGTSDIPVAEEASVTLEVMDCAVQRLYDCGVAGIHRLIDVLPALRRAQAIICVAGMEGALPSVVAGLVDRPVIAVPTSVGYGASFGGITPLLTMLNSCATGVAVMNIDNGFGAACFAYMILHNDRKKE